MLVSARGCKGQNVANDIAANAFKVTVCFCETACHTHNRLRLLVLNIEYECVGVYRDREKMKTEKAAKLNQHSKHYSLREP